MTHRPLIAILRGITPAEGLRRLMAREQKAEYPQALFAP